MTGSYVNAYVLMHPLRRRIVESLQKEEMYTAKIARELGMADKERLIGFHLSIMAEGGFVDGEFRLANPVTATPKAVKYYHLTEKARATLRQIADELGASAP